MRPATVCERCRRPSRAAAADGRLSPMGDGVRELMTAGRSWTGSAADLLRAGANRSRDDVTVGGPGWPKNPRALAGRLRRAQTFLRALGIDITFSREGRAGSRIIRMHTTLKNPVCTVSSVCDHGPYVRTTSASGTP